MTDRIKQMAEEAGIDLDPHGGIHRAYTEHLAKFAALVAEDCADIVDNADTPDCGGWTAGGISDTIRARFGIAVE